MNHFNEIRKGISSAGPHRAGVNLLSGTPVWFSHVLKVRVCLDLWLQDL